MGSINVLGLDMRLGIPVLQASTSEVYGDPDAHPQNESYWGRVNPVGPRSCYHEGKRVAETLFFDYWRQHALSIKVMRIFNTYGPRMDPDDGRVVSNFIVQALKGEDITIYGDGLQTRSFCFVDDLIDGMIALMATDDAVTGPINIGNPVEFTILELAQTILELTGSRSRTSTARWRKTIRNSAAPTFPWQPANSGGLRASSSSTALSAPLSTSGRR